jgi:hypothetical protein
VPLVLLMLVACSTSPSPSGSGLAASPNVTPAPTPAPTPTPVPTPDFTNAPDPALTALIPDTIDGAAVVKPDPSTFGVTPGDVGTVFGAIGLRFRSLVIAYVVSPRLSLYAMRVEGASVDTADLQPYLASAGEYIGVAGLHPDAWKETVVDGNRVWTRGEDAATLPGTTFYCWSSGQYVFLLTGSSDKTNRAMVSALPGQPAPTPTPAPTSSAPTSPSASVPPSASGSPGAVTSPGQ